ncbi:MAG: pyridoxal phosphate-dependent aminotransferase [Natronospirillum sp.]|uniref:pyridoxal phosphate-dependent aminotransferase n=1 Tax=Natronospirillum sp. TaxID=2812955 RepID=UPI0025D5EF00|nr:pyridoxal phosphate-dependent aminotransferase [Natronospirillum sp.]MCH8550822.1 pyridoxal phosphate-dependent aminotransferase [Natronospirillum sp.]
MDFKKSLKLANVFYDIRGPVLQEAKRLEDEGHRILKLNIGNPAPFGFNAPDEIITDVIRNLNSAEGYSDSRGIYPARKAVMQYYQQKRVANVDVEDIILGNGVSELIVMTMQALLNDGDQVLVPAPDYPLWTGAVTLSGGQAVHYMCDEQQDWYPDIDDIKAKITDRTKAIVLINPNNPTGAVYSKELLEEVIELARQHSLLLLADEIYDKITFDDTPHHSVAELCDDVLCITFNGLSKVYRLAGFRSGWMMLSGPKHRARDLMEGLSMLANMRLCSNVPAQLAIQTSLGGYQTIYDLTAPGGRMYEQRNLAHEMLTSIPGITCVKPKGALYLFPKIDTRRFNIHNDEKFILDFLREQKILMVHGRAFNWPEVDHFRIVFLPNREDLTECLEKLERFLDGYRQQ